MLTLHAHCAYDVNRETNEEQVEMRNPQVFTGFVIGKCANGHTTRIDTRGYAMLERSTWAWSSASNWIEDCHDPHCARAVRVAFCKPINGRLVEDVKCSPKCMGAVGPSCDCSCAGENHGGAH